MPHTLPSADDHLAAATRAVADVPGLPDDTPRRPIRRVGVIGAGTMGGGIAMNFLTAGIPVTLVETSADALERGLGVMRSNYQRSADKGRFPVEEVDRRMGRATGSLDLADLADCDLVIEAVFEDMALKKEVFARLDAVATPGAILATNTSALDIDEIATATDRPGDVIGLHFFSPANVMRMVEVVRAARTTDDVVATCMDLVRDVGKIGVLVGVCPGFVGNRMLFWRQAQAMALVRRGVLPWDVDAALTGFGFRMGPFQMSDLAGLDIGWRPGATTENPIRDRLCESGRRGQKTGAGYYDYDDDRTPHPSDEVADLIRSITGADDASMPADEIVAACLYPLIDEGVRILEEGKAQRPGDIDVMWIHGYGWPAATGGPMYHGDVIGADRLLAGLEALTVQARPVEPTATLRRLAAEGGLLTELDLGGLRVG